MGNRTQGKKHNIEDEAVPLRPSPIQRQTFYKNVDADRITLFDHTLNRGTRIYLEICDITRLIVGAVVNPANERFSHIGGVALAISKAAGPSFQQHSNEYIRKYGPLPLASVSIQMVNFLPCQYVINAVGPSWDMFRNKDKCR